MFKKIFKSPKLLFWIIRRSLTMDYKTLVHCTFLSFAQRCTFIFVKYVTLVKNAYSKIVTGETYTRWGTKDIYYADIFGIGGLQATFSEQMVWLQQLDLGEFPTIVEIGANVGFFSLGCKQLFPNCTIHAFEPNPQVFIILKKNLDVYNSINLYEFAAGPKNERLTLQSDSQNPSYASFIKQRNRDVSFDVEVKRLDDILPQVDIDLIQIDVEGFEMEVMQGAKETLKRTKYLLLEMDNEDYSLSNVFDLFRSINKDLKILFFRSLSNSDKDKIHKADVLFEILDVK